MKYILFGGSGFIGTHLATALAKKHEVTIVGRAPSFNLPNVNYKQLDFVQCHDFTDCIKKADVIIHLVSTIIPSEDLSHINQEISSNVFPTTILLENAAKLGKTVIFVSSGGTVYGENSKPNTELSATNPICNYGVSKLFIEKYLALFHHFYDMDYRIIRLANPYSEEIHHGKKQGIIPIIIDNIVNNQPITIWGDKQIRDYIHIDDAIDGISAILNYTGSERIFNLGTGVGYTVNDIIDLAEKKLKKTAQVQYQSARKCDVKNNILDISLIQQETSWSPKITLEQGIDRVIKNKLNRET